MGRPLSASFRALRDGRHPVRENGPIQGARPLPDFAGWQSRQPEAETQQTQHLEEEEEPWLSEGDPALLAFESSTGTVPPGHSDPAAFLEAQHPDLDIELFDQEEFDYDPLGLGFDIA